MRKLLFTTAFFSIVLIGYLFALIISLVLYHSHVSNRYLTSHPTVVYAALPTVQNNFSTEIVTQDARMEKVKQFFALYNSPLEPFAEDIVTAADEYGLDYRLLPAIAMQESNLCKRIPHGSNNCWGFGIYGTTVTKFSDYPEAIRTVTKTLATKYKAKGLVTPDEIMTMYTPSSDGSWAFSVNQFMDQLQ